MEPTVLPGTSKALEVVLYIYIYTPNQIYVSMQSEFYGELLGLRGSDFARAL